MKIKAYAAEAIGAELKPFEYELGELKDEDVEIKVEYCGICHSDLSMLNNEWGMTQYPFVPGHEIIGTICAIGKKVKTLSIGQRVGLGWFSSSCMTCDCCMSGDHNLCSNAEGTIVGRYGGFAEKVRSHFAWAIPLPESLKAESAGPLFCGGITVFNPIVQLNIKPTDKVGIIGIGGLGHMALSFLKAWGCEVTAFSSNPSKSAEALEMGANHFVNSCNVEDLNKLKNSFDCIVSTANADLDWTVYISLLKAKGKLHFVGVAPNPVSTHVFPLISGQKSISGSPLGSPATTAKMLDFAVRHHIEPTIEIFPLSEVNQAIAKLKSGKAHYRIVLKND